MNISIFNNKISPLLRDCTIKSETYPFRTMRVIPTNIEDVDCCFRFLDLNSEFKVVLWMEHKITICEITEGQTALSFNFEGCYMAKFEYNNKLYIAHIHRGINRDCGEKWNSLINSPAIRVLALFNPCLNGSYIHTTYVGRYLVCGLITPDNDCFSVLVDPENSMAGAVQQWMLISTPHVIPHAGVLEFPGQYELNIEYAPI